MLEFYTSGVHGVRRWVDKRGMRSGRQLTVATVAIAVLCIAGPPARGQSRVALTNPVPVRGLAISPDGHLLAYLENDKEGRQEFWLKDLRTGTRTRLATGRPPSHLQNLSFSPDGRSLLFYGWEDKTLRRMAVSGGRSTPVAKIPSLGVADWGDNGEVVFVEHLAARPGEIRRVRASGRESRLVASLAQHEAVTDLQVLPGSRAVLLSVVRGNTFEVVVQPLNGGRRRVVIEGSGNARYIHATKQIAYRFSERPFGLGSDLWTASFDAVALRMTTIGARVAEGVLAPFVISPTGTLAYATTPMELVRVFRDGRRMPLGTLHQHTRSARVSPDGRHVAFTRDGVWVADLQNVTSSMRRLTSGVFDSAPIWSPDSRRIAFGRKTYPPGPERVGFEADRYNAVDTILSVQIDRRGAVESIVGHGDSPEFWSAANGRLAYQRYIPGNGASLWTTSPGDRVSRLVLHGNADLHSALSPDGKWIAFEWRRGTLERWESQLHVYVSSYRSGGTPTLVTTTEAHTPLWSLDGTELFIESDHRILATRMRVDPLRAAPTFSDPIPLPIARTELKWGRSDYEPRQYDLMPDGASFLMLLPAQPELVVMPNALNGRAR
jgi:Tol biopolymer transport system component